MRGFLRLGHRDGLARPESARRGQLTKTVPADPGPDLRHVVIVLRVWVAPTTRYVLLL
jgi:hypothetical protein